MRKLTAFLGDERGATAIEYALLASFVAMSIIAGMIAIAGKVDNTLTDVGNGF